ncbi:MAG: ABC transporter permease [Alphaproteobacteria bacterium]
MADSARAPGLVLALRLARRELRGGIRGWGVFLACLALGVAAVAGIGSLSAAIEEGIRADGKAILGGDVELRLVHRPAKAGERRFLAKGNTVSATVEMRAMARPVGQGTGQPKAARILIELKAVDGAYPLYGSIRLAPPMPLAGALKGRDGLPGAVVAENLLRRLALKVGDRLRIGEADFVIAAKIAHEPDRGARVFILGPRVIIPAAALARTGLVQPGSLVYYHYRLRLPATGRAGPWIEEATRRFPKSGWRIRDVSGAAPGLRRMVRRVTLFMTFVGLTALLIGGVGVAGAVGAYLSARRDTIATLKCLGAPGRLIFELYLIQITVLAAIGIFGGLAVGAAVPWLLGSLLEGQLPVPVRVGLYAGPLVLAGAYGALTALAFSLWPLARAREVPAAALFRDVVARAHKRPRIVYMAATALSVLGLAGLAVWAAPDRFLAAWFVIAAAGSFLAFRASAKLLAFLAAGAGRRAQARGTAPRLRLALANLHRPGAPTPAVVLSLGLGLTALVAIAQIEGNISNQIRERMPTAAPTFFFIDIQSAQVPAFDRALAKVPGVEKVERMPTLRARIVRVASVPVARANIDPAVRWAVASERGLTYAGWAPPGTRIVAGKWWPPGYKGPPIISFDARIARGMGLKVGDTITFNVLGREITARIANLRAIDWTTLGMNFTVIFAPGTLEKAPHSFIATVRAAPGAEGAVLAAVTGELANVSAVRVKDALETIAGMLARLGGAVRATGAVTLLAGLLVLAGAVAAGHDRRVYDGVVLKVLGARRRDILQAFLIEFGLLGLATACVAALLGTAAAYGVITQIMHAPWTFLASPVVVTIVLASAVTMVFGFAGVWRALGRKPASFLRND